MDDKIVLNNVKALVLDIEGTTTSICFVKDILFPYVRKNIKQYLRNKWATKELTEDINALRKQAEEDVSLGKKGAMLIPPLENASDDTVEIIHKKVMANVLCQMDEDRKTTSLKQLQGHMWHTAYAKGDIKGHIYDDVPPALHKWQLEGKKIYIYSSGSVQAQILLFGNSVYGDLCKSLNGYFDTNTGPKFESKSYKIIAETIGLSPENILFLTDVAKEAEAAKEAGMQAIIVVREGNAQLTEVNKNMFKQITSFAGLVLS